MIITNIIGGLGNQLFQYATGKHLADKHGVEHKIDISGFMEYKLHSYSLDKFNISATIANPSEIETLRIHQNTCLYEQTPLFDRRVLTAGPNVYLRGQWQSEMYFKDIRGVLLKEFTLNQDLNPTDLKILSEINKTNSVAIHIRRMDFTSNSNHGVCDMRYYKKAIQYITQAIPEPTFFVFSDDPDWVEQNLKTNYPCVYVKHNTAARNFADLHLMSQCKHFIIANSTFSWWGAWLSQNEGKIIIAPKQWFGNKIDSKNLSKNFFYSLVSLTKHPMFEDKARDLIPSSWVRI